MATIDRKVLRSISELSSFKFMLVLYLVFFIISVIIMGIVALLAWLGLSSSGMDIAQVLQSFGIPDYGLLNLAGGSALVYIGIAIIVGLIASVFHAALGALMVWIVNMVLRIIGGLELRFIEKEETPKPE